MKHASTLHSFVKSVFPLCPNLSVKTDTNTYMYVTISYIPSLYHIRNINYLLT